MAQSGGWVMSARDDLRLKIIGDFREGKVTKKEASEVLGVSPRTISRWTAKIRGNGPVGILHGNRGKAPANRSLEEERARILELVRVRYFDFNMTHCHEYLVRDHGLKVSYTTFRMWCRAANIGKRRRRRASKARVSRERMANRGLLLQMDGSEHAWNGDDKWTLVGAIDDASSEIAGIGFFKKENTFSCLAVLRSIVETVGIPVALYVDQANWYGGIKAECRTQFSRACNELGIALIAARSPQAKGRIERTWHTFQDRLIPELRLNAIDRMEDANRYLHEKFLPDYWQSRNTVEPREAESRYRKVDPSLSLNEVFCLKYDRKVDKGHTINWCNVVYRLSRPFKGSISGKHVTIHEYENGRWRVFYGPMELEATRHLTPERRRWQRAS